MKFIFTVLTVVLALLSPSAHADVILSNISGSPTYSGGSGPSSTTFKAVGLTTGSTALRFDSLIAVISNNDTISHNVGGGIYDDVSGSPGSVLYVFTPVTVTPGTTNSLTTFNAAGATLNPSTSYWFVINSDSTNTLVRWPAITPNTAPTATGVTYLGYKNTTNGGTSWASSSALNAVSIQATAALVREPSPLAFVVLGVAWWLVLLAKTCLPNNPHKLVG